MDRNRVALNFGVVLMVGIIAFGTVLGGEPKFPTRSRSLISRVSSSTVTHMKNEYELLKRGIQAVQKSLRGQRLSTEEKKDIYSTVKHGLTLFGLIATAIVISKSAQYLIEQKKKREEASQQKALREEQQWKEEIESLGKWVERVRILDEAERLEKQLRAEEQEKLSRFVPFRSSKEIVSYAQLMDNYQHDPNRAKLDELLTAVEQNDVKKVQTLLKEGVNPNFASESGSPLEQALDIEDVGKGSAMVRLLLEHGANPNIIEDKGTLLHREPLPVEHRTLLLRFGADPNISTTRGVTPLMRASNAGIILLLLNYGADPSQKDYDGKNAFDYHRDSPGYLEILGNYMAQKAFEEQMKEVSAVWETKTEEEIKEMRGRKIPPLPLEVIAEIQKRVLHPVPRRSKEGKREE